MSEQPRDESVPNKYTIRNTSYRFFGVYEGETLVCITVYRKGAVEVIRRLTALEEALSKKPAQEVTLPNNS